MYLAQNLFRRYLYQRSPKAYYTTRRTLANYYQQLLTNVELEGDEDVHASEEWQELAIACIVQLFLLPDKASHISAAELVLSLYEYTKQTEEVAKVLRRLMQEQPDNHVKEGARSLVQLLLRYAEIDLTAYMTIQKSEETDFRNRNKELITIASELLKRVTPSELLKGVTSSHSSSPKLLSRVYRRRGTIHNQDLGYVLLHSTHAGKTGNSVEEKQNME